MKHILIPVLICIICTMAIGQKPNIFYPENYTYIPDEYNAQYQQAVANVVDITTPGDFVELDPLEQVPIIPTEVSTMNGGNWGYLYYGIEEFKAEIEANAQRKVAVFIFDTGASWDHPALQKAYWPEKSRDFTGTNPEDRHGHSTHVAGIIGATDTELNVGIAEALVRRDRLKLIGYKVLNDNGFGSTQTIVRAINTANEEAKGLVNDGWFVMYNFSLGSQSTSTIYDEGLRQAEETGVLVFGASGNDSKEFINNPSRGPNIHAVGSLDPSSERSAFSNYGAQLYMGSPGSRIYSTFTNGTFRELSGTSMASPHQCAIAAICASVNPMATNRQISHYLRRFNLDLGGNGWDKYTGYGVNILQKWFYDDPTREVDQGNGNPDTPNFDPPIDEPDPVTKKRRIVHVLRDVYILKYRTEDASQTQSARVTLDVKYTNKLGVFEANQYLRENTMQFFNTNLIILESGSDMYEAGCWAWYFYERELNDLGLDIEVEQLEIIDTNTTWLKACKPSGLNAKLKRLFNPEIRALNIN